MGIIIGKIWRKKTTVEVLENLDKEIKTIEEYRKNTEQSHQRIVGRFIVISVGIYLVTAFLFYFYFFPATFYDRLFYIIPLILAPVIILTVKRVLTWYYKWKINRKQNKLSTLKDEKKKMLEKVMETETYKVAKSILEKFSEPTVRKGTIALPSEFATPRKALGTPAPPGTAIAGGLRQRALPAPNQQLIPATPIRPVAATHSSTTIRQDFSRTPMPPPSVGPGVVGTPLPMPRSILPRDRSVFDKMVDYLVGDGPTNRFALICKNCSSHNGMAFREEFEYISFRCCYCYTLNPARKKRPAAPKLEFELKSPHRQSDTSESEKNSPSDTDSESETLTKLKLSAQQKPDVVEELKHTGLLDETKDAGPVQETKLLGPLEQIKQTGPVEETKQTGPVEEIKDTGPVEETKLMDLLDELDVEEPVPMDLDSSLENIEETINEEEKVDEMELIEEEMVLVEKEEGGTGDVVKKVEGQTGDRGSTVTD